jgi:hypothetical protein
MVPGLNGDQLFVGGPAGETVLVVDPARPDQVPR